MLRAAIWLASLVAATATAAGPTSAPTTPAAPRLRVMLDAGHGGSNTGAPGVVAGVYEKRVTLAVTRALAADLRAAGIDVVMTRHDDRYLTLRERVRRANAAGVDVFVSVHANASPAHAQRGYETYVLAPAALTTDARALRHDDGPPRPGVPEAARVVLDELEREAAQEGALRLAQRVQARLSEVRGPEGNRGVRHGSMDVLMGPVMPAVLVEVGFVDHPVEGVELLRSDVRAGIATALSRAILEWGRARP